MRLRDTTIVVATVIAGFPALAQQIAPEGRVYVFHSRPAGQCPELDWHVVVGGDNTLSATIVWNNGKNMANVAGAIHANGTFRMDGKEIDPTSPWPIADCPPRCPAEGKGQGAVITGKLRDDGWLTASIKGQNIDCQGIEVRRPPSGDVGGKP
jgi:hypothetical protein